MVYLLSLRVSISGFIVGGTLSTTETYPDFTPPVSKIVPMELLRLIFRSPSIPVSSLRFNIRLISVLPSTITSYILLSDRLKSSGGKRNE